MSPRTPKATTEGLGFLLSQTGHRAATLFADLLTPLELTPALAGILRLISRRPGLSQIELAQQLNLMPSRVVSFVDELETRGYLTRRRSDADRRVYALQLTAKGDDLMIALAGVAREHDRQLATGLSTEERNQLRTLLGRVAQEHNLTPAVHPGYRGLRGEESAAKPAPRRRAT